MRWIWTDDLARRLAAVDAPKTRILRRLIDAPVAIRVDADVADEEIARLLGLLDLASPEARDRTPLTLATRCGHACSEGRTASPAT